MTEHDDGRGTDECCEHCQQMRKLFRELDNVIDGLLQRIRNAEDKRDH